MGAFNFQSILKEKNQELVNVDVNQQDITQNNVPGTNTGLLGSESQNQVVPNQQQMMQQQPDPFAMSPYNNVRMNDAPLSFGGGMAEQLLNDKEVPQEIKEKYWFVFHKDNTLTFLDETRKASKLLNYDIIKIDILNSVPYYDYTFEKELEFGILRNVFETKLDRALGFKGGNIKNERVILQSQFSENRQISEMNSGGGLKEGFFKRLLGRR